MTTYLLTFRLSESHRAFPSYVERYDALTSLAETHSYWKEPTSFYIFQSTKTANQLIKNIESAIDASEDVVLLRAITSGPYYLIGKCEDDTISSLIPSANLSVR